MTSDYIFGVGRRFITGVLGNAWNMPQAVKDRKGEVIFYDWRNSDIFTNYDSLNPGDVIGLYYSESNFRPDVSYQDIGETRALTGGERGNTEDIDFTHVALYLGKIENKHYITHFIHDDGIRIEPIEDFLTSPQYKNKMFIRAIMRPDQEQLYREVPKYETQDYMIKESDNIKDISQKLNNGLRWEENAWLISSYNGIYEPNYLEKDKKIKIPTSRLITESSGVEKNNLINSLAVKINKKYNKEDSDNFGLNWARIIYNNAKYKDSPKYLSLIASFIFQPRIKAALNPAPQASPAPV
mgnify:FL=1